jgi:hypothetical protein
MKKPWMPGSIIKKTLVNLAVICSLISCKKDIIPDLQLKQKSFDSGTSKSIINSKTAEHIKFKGILWDINDVWFMHCNNEYVHVRGTINYSLNSLKKGNTLHFAYQFHYQNVHGIGQTSGAKYTFTGHASEQQNLYYDPATGFVAKTFNITNKLVTTTQGGINSITTISYHINRNAAGDLVVDKVKFETNVCKKH